MFYALVYSVTVGGTVEIMEQKTIAYLYNDDILGLCFSTEGVHYVDVERQFMDKYCRARGLDADAYYDAFGRDAALEAARNEFFIHAMIQSGAQAMYHPDTGEVSLVG